MVKLNWYYADIIQSTSLQFDKVRQLFYKLFKQFSKL